MYDLEKNILATRNSPTSIFVKSFSGYTVIVMILSFGHISLWYYYMLYSHVLAGVK